MSTTNPLTVARRQVAALVRGLNLGVPVHDEPPEAPSGTCVVINPGDPWMVRRGLVGGARIGLDVTVLVPVAGGRSMLARLEQLAWDIESAGVWDDGPIRRTPQVPSPQTVLRLRYGQAAEFYATNIPITVAVNPTPTRRP